MWRAPGTRRHCGEARLGFAVPGDLATPTGGYAYDRRIIAELTALGWQVDVIGLGEGFPRPSAQQKSLAQEWLDAVPKDCPIVIDGLALGVLPEAAQAIKARRPLIALVHHPLALETGVTPEDARMLQASEQAALAATHGVIVTSAPTARPGCRLRRRRRPDHRGAARHRPRRGRARQQRRHRAAAVGRCGGTAQGLRRADRGARHARKLAVAAVHRRRPHARCRDGGATRFRHRALRSRRAHRCARRGRSRSRAVALCRGGHFRAGVAFRGLRHGLRRGDRARLARDWHDRRRDPGNGAGGSGRAGRARRRAGAGARACDG